MLRTRTMSGLVAGAAAVALLALGPGSASAAATGSPAGDKPAALESAKVAAKVHAQATSRTHGTPNILLKDLFTAGTDELPEANVSALCQSFIGTPNPYAPIAPNVNAITGDTIVSVGSQTGCSAAQNETTVAQNPNNPRNLVAGSNDYRVFNARENRHDR